MNLLKQTALVLGLASLSIGGWTLYRNWRQKIAILFSVLCFFVSVWALSFVSSITLIGRLSRDLHWFFNVCLAPIGVVILSQILSKENALSKCLRWISLLGAALLGAAISFSVIPVSVESPWFLNLVSFWPTCVFIQFVNVLVQDLVYHHPVNVDFVSFGNRVGLYIGLGLSLLICSFDHIPALGYTVPAIGNLLFTVYLVFVSQMVTPQKLLRLETLVSRFLATIILSLIITGFFALLYQYISESFPLFLLNSFLISFAILVLWSPLVTFFRFLANQIFTSERNLREHQIQNFQMALATVTDMAALQKLLNESFTLWLGAENTRIVSANQLPEAFRRFLETTAQQKVSPILHRELVKMERDQVLTQERKNELKSLMQYLDFWETDMIFPVFSQRTPQALILVNASAALDEWNVGLSFYSKIFEALQEVSNTLTRLSQIEMAKEKDRLILLGEMAAGLAHEIRNPLGSIRGAAELIDQEATPWAKVIQEEVNRLNRLVSQFLDFAHAPKDKPETINLSELVRNAMIYSQAGVPANVVVKAVYPSEVIWVKGVPDHLQQILINLVQNAIKAVDGLDHPLIEIEVLTSGFRVRDNGIGMSEETLQKVFQPFFTSFKNGTGLGLSICERLIRFNDGKITLSSNPGKGTEVQVSLQPGEGGIRHA